MSSKIAAVVSAAVLVAFSGAALAESTGSRIDRDKRRVEKQVDDKVWFYAKDAKSVGPLNTEDLVDAAEDGDIKRDTQVYHPDAGWRAASAVPELKSALN